MRALLSLLTIVLLASCAPRTSKINVFREPEFNIRPLDDHSFAVTAKNIREIIERLGCGVDTTCAVSHAGEVFVARTGAEQVLIQIPMKTLPQILEEVGCGKFYVCAGTHDGKILVVKRKD